MKIWLRLVLADGDVAAALLRPWRWSYAFVALLYPFYIESEIPIRFYNDLGASTALLLRSCGFCYDSCHFDQNFESKRYRRPVEWGGGGGVNKVHVMF